jgi:dTDP-4-dehydrorhamnose reductase
MKILLAGGSGQLGQELMHTKPGGCHLEAPDSKTLNLQDPHGVMRHVARSAPDIVINAAGYTAVDQAQSAPQKAFAINGEGAGVLAEAAVGAGAKVIYISTDYVFDGRQSTPYRPGDTPRPISTYGASKLAGERRVRQAAGNALIIRTAWLYSVYGGNFVKTMLGLMKDRDRVAVVADQIGTPTWARGLADAIWQANEKGIAGLYHWTDAGVASWFDLAVAVYEEARHLGFLSRPVSIVPIPGEAYPSAAPRPAYSVLDKNDLWQSLGRVPGHWRQNLRRMLSLPGEETVPVAA